jgi:ligand-binding sensor domain-containing protein
MKTTLSLLAIIILISCEILNDSSYESINTEFTTKILDGYFVTSIAFDNHGNAWIGTFNQGLIKYDSTGVIVYNSDNSIIPDYRQIYDLAIDSKNILWIASEGLIKYDGDNFTHYTSSNTPMPEEHVSSIGIDSKDNVWFASSRFQRGGIVKYNGTDWTVYTPRNSDLPANLVGSIAIDGNDNVWVSLLHAYDSQLVKISNDNWTVYTNRDLRFAPYGIGNIQIDSKHRLYGSVDYGTSSIRCHDDTQVFIYNGRVSERLQFDDCTKVNLITVDRNDNVWCGTHNGYAVYNGEKWTFNDTRFIDEGVYAIAQSPDGKIWMGTPTGIYINN